MTLVAMKKKNKKAGLAVPAFAKINLHLAIGSHRPDGYHSLHTLFQEISLQDRLVCRLTDGAVQLTTNASHIPTGKDNLILKALLLLKKELGVSGGIHVELDKQIPTGAGLGGGSSDAAAALWAGWVLWKRIPGAEAIKRGNVPALLYQCARRLGADVPFFLAGGRAEGRGIGDRLTSLPKTKKRWLVLVYPRVFVSTPKAYGWLDEARGQRGFGRRDSGSVERRPNPLWPRKYRNDFEAVVFPRFPAVLAAHTELKTLGCRQVMMSGSGASVFGFVKNRLEGARILRRLKSKRWDSFLVHTL